MQLVDGTLTSLDQLPEYTDRAQITKSMKIPQKELSIGSLADAVCCRVAAHDLEKA